MKKREPEGTPDFICRPKIRLRFLSRRARRWEGGEERAPGSGRVRVSFRVWDDTCYDPVKMF